MSRPRVPLQTALWAAGTLASLGLYAVRAVHLPRRTSVGTERRLFAGTGYTLLQHPANGRWLVSTPQQFAPTTAPPPPTFWTILSERLNAFQWPGGVETGRTLAPFRDDGTWSIEPSGLRRVWRLRTTELKQDSSHQYLVLSDPPAVLELKTGRTYRGEEAQRRINGIPYHYDGTGEYGEGGTAIPDLLPLDGGDTTSPRDLNTNRSVAVGNRSVSLLWNDPLGPGTALYAASDHAAPRVLRLARAAAFNQLSPDGRTLFFERDGALWRLDLRRPLPELLDAAASPALPEPDLAPAPAE